MIEQFSGWGVKTDLWGGNIWSETWMTDILYTSKVIYIYEALCSCYVKKKCFHHCLIMFWTFMKAHWNAICKPKTLCFQASFIQSLDLLILHQSGSFKIWIKINPPVSKQIITNIHKALESSLSASIFSNLLPSMFLISVYVHVCMYVYVHTCCHLD